MNIIKTLLSIAIPALFVFGVSSTAQASNDKTASIDSIDAVLIRDKITIGTHAPKNYFLDSGSAASMGVCALYVKNGQTFHDSPIIIYSRIADPKIKEDKGIETLIAEVMKAYKSASKNVKEERKPDYKSKGGLAFRVHYFLNGPNPNNFEAAAYLKYNGGIVMSIMSARSQKELTNSESAFFDYLDRIAPYSTEFPKGMANCMYPTKAQKK